MAEFGMDTAVICLDRLLKHPDPGFVCALPYEDPAKRFVARVRHFAGGEATREDLKWLRDALGDSWKELGVLYAMHDGALLFSPVIRRWNLKEGEDGGFRYFPVSELQDLSEARLGNLLELWGPEAQRPQDVFPFAEVPLSANLIAVRSAGPERGTVVELNHDCPPGGFGLPTDLASLLVWVCMEPESFFRASGGYTFYADGETDAQWRPIGYFPDCRTLTAEQIASVPILDWWPGRE
jgi:hypothetical protein